MDISHSILSFKPDFDILERNEENFLLKVCSDRFAVYKNANYAGVIGLLSEF